MQAASVTRIEKNVDRAASALFALACGYAAFVWFRATASRPVAEAESAAAAAASFWISASLLKAVRPRSRKLPVPVFDVRDVEPMDANGEGVTMQPQSAQAERAEEALLLDDILAELGPESRVVRLFDPAAMPTPGQLQSRIERHLDRHPSAEQSSEATQALHDALAELRRSFR
jgi:hypothetical protein